MDIIIRTIYVVANPPSRAEMEKMEDEGWFGTNGIIADDKWLEGMQFALSEDGYDSLDTLEFKQFAYYRNGSYKLVGTCESIFYGDDDGERFLNMLRADMAPSSDDNRLYLVFATFRDPMEFRSEYEGEWFTDGFVTSHFGEGGEVCVEQQEEQGDLSTFCGVYVSYRQATIDEKYIITVKPEDGDGDEEELVDLESYLASQDFQAVLNEDNYHDKWEYAAYGIVGRGGDSGFEDSESDDEDGCEEMPPLCEAANNADIEQIKSLLADGADVNAKAGGWPGGDTALMKAAGSSSDTAAEAVKLLLAAGADVNVKNNADKTALMCAAASGAEVFRLLLAAGAEVNARDDRGRTALMEAVKSLGAGVESVKLLLDAGADVQPTDDDGWTALMEAAGSVGAGAESVKRLLDAGAEVNAKSEFGRTALMQAAGNWGNVSAESVKLLLAAGAEVNAKDSDGGTALMDAAGSWRNTSAEAVKLLLAAGAEVDAKDNEGRTALSFAKERGKEEIVRLLCDAGADEKLCSDSYDDSRYDAEGGRTEIFSARTAKDVKLLLAVGADVNARNKYDGTPLMDLVQSDASVGAVREMLAAGADVEAQNDEGITALMLATAENAKLLLAAGAGVESVDYHNRTALMYASGGNENNPEPNVEAVKVLIAAGADVNAQDINEKTALMYARECDADNSDEVVELLLAAGADDISGYDDSEFEDSDNGDDSDSDDSESEDDDGDDSDESGSEENPLCQAARNGDIDKIKSLLAAGADVNGKDKNGVAALMYAAGKCGNSAAVQALLDAGADVNATDKNGATALMRAAEKGDIPIIKQLLDAGADVNTTTERRGMTALKFAAESGKEDAVQALRQAGATGETSDPDKELLAQAQQGDKKSLEKLLNALTIEDVWVFPERVWRYYDIPEGESTFGSERYNRVLAAFLDKAEGGDAAAQYAVGRLFYQWGLIYEDANPDAYQKRISWYQESYNWFERAADNYYGAAADYYCAIQSETELGTSFDLNYVLSHYEMCIYDEHYGKCALSNVMQLIEDHYDDEGGGEGDFTDTGYGSDAVKYHLGAWAEGHTKALDWLLEKAQDDDEDAFKICAQMLERASWDGEEDGGFPTFEALVLALVKAADAGSSEAQNVLDEAPLFFFVKYPLDAVHEAAKQGSEWAQKVYESVQREKQERSENSESEDDED